MSQNHRIMVVDDDATQNMICRYLINSIEPEIEIALFTNPEDAFTSIKKLSDEDKKDKSTIVLLDINMPFMTGWEFLEAFEKLPLEYHKQFNVYMLSSSIDEQDRIKARENKFVSGYITKPLKKENIREIITRVA